MSETSRDMAKKTLEPLEDNFKDMNLVKCTSECDNWAKMVPKMMEEILAKYSVIDQRRLDKFEAEIQRMNDALKQQNDHLKNLANKVNQLSRHVEATFLGIDTLTNLLREAGIYFDDSMLHFPHDFVDQFDSYFAGTDVPEYHKCLAFLSVLTNVNEDWKNSLRGITEYKVLKRCFFRDFWDSLAQSKAADRCLEDFKNVGTIDREIIFALLRWANSLCHYEAPESEFQRILGHHGYDIWTYKREPGQSVAETRKRILRLRKKFNPDIYVPIQNLPYLQPDDDDDDQ